MRLLGTRRAALVAGVATVAAVALTGCSAGQVAETALKKPSNMGVNATSSTNAVVIRNLAVAYNGTQGYEAGANAPLELAIFNKTTAEITVNVSSQPLAGAAEGRSVVSARQVALTGGTASAPPSAAPEPSGTGAAATPDTETPENVSPPPAGEPSPTAQPPASAEGAARPARITIEPMGYVSFLPGDGESVEAVGLTGALVPGASLNLVFEFSDGAEPLVLQAPMAIPLSPASRAPGSEGEHSEPE